MATSRQRSLLLRLVFHLFNRGRNRFRIPKKLHGDHRFQILVQFVHERDARGQVQLHDLLVAHFIQVAYDPPQRVPVSRNEDSLACVRVFVLVAAVVTYLLTFDYLSFSACNVNKGDHASIFLRLRAQQ